MTMKTHRCEGVKKHHTPIRFVGRGLFQSEGEKRWRLFRLGYNYESLSPFTPLLEYVTDVNYCPYCGRKLKGVENDDERRSN